MCNEPDGPQAYAKTLEADLTQLQQAENLQGYLQVQTFLNGLVFGKLSPIRKFSGDVQKKETVMEIRSDVKKKVETLQKKIFCDGSGDTSFAAETLVSVSRRAGKAGT